MFLFLLLHAKLAQNLPKTTFHLMTLWVKKPGEFNRTVFLFHLASAEFSQGGQMTVASSGESNMAPLTCLEPWWASLNSLFIWPLKHGVSGYSTTYMVAQSSQKSVPRDLSRSCDFSYVLASEIPECPLCSIFSQ